MYLAFNIEKSHGWHGIQKNSHNYTQYGGKFSLCTVTSRSTPGIVGKQIRILKRQSDRGARKKKMKMEENKTRMIKKKIGNRRKEKIKWNMKGIYISFKTILKTNGKWTRKRKWLKCLLVYDGEKTLLPPKHFTEQNKQVSAIITWQRHSWTMKIRVFPVSCFVFCFCFLYIQIWITARHLLVELSPEGW